jgi:DNA-binding IclR family transcriptional regulator
LTDRKYTAPALEKGLDILNLLADHGQAMTLSQISAALGRSVGEIFRMIHVLQFKGFIEASTSSNDGYQLTNRLFTLGMARAPVKNLMEAALPHMRNLAAAVEQSCHLAIVSREEIVVVARIENPGYFGYSVRPGHRRPIVEATSGMVLFAFQPKAIQERWKEDIFAGVSKADQKRFLTNAAEVAAQGFWRAESDLMAGVTDISAPVQADNAAVAALTMPYMKRKGARPIETTIDLLRATAELISGEIQGVA